MHDKVGGKRETEDLRVLDLPLHCHEFVVVPCDSVPRNCCLLWLFPALAIFTPLSPILYESFKVLLSPHSQNIYKLTCSENTMSLF